MSEALANKRYIANYLAIIIYNSFILDIDRSITGIIPEFQG